MWSAPLNSIHFITTVITTLLLPYYYRTGNSKEAIGHTLFPKLSRLELRFWHNFVPDMHDSSEK